MSENYSNPEEEECLEQEQQITTSVEEVKADTANQNVTVQDRLVQIPLSVVVSTRNLIEILTSRGNVFKANELTHVGNLFNNYTAVVNKAIEDIKKESVVSK